MKFYCDDPVDLTCGCTAQPDDNYHVIHLPVWNNAEKKYEIKKYTYCGDNDCLYSIVADDLEIEMRHVNTSYENEQEYLDAKADEAWERYKNGD